MPEKTGIASTINRTNTHKHRLIICGLSSIQSEVIARLSRQAELAYILRKPQKVDAVCTQLEQAHAPIASYFRGLAAQRDGNGDLRQAEKLLEYAADRAPRGYQARALVALGSIAEYRADYRAELEFYRAALKLNQTDVFTAVEARRAIAISARRAGDHARAIQILESILPLASREPYLQAQVLNHLAVEYHDAGRLQEAYKLAQAACSSSLVTIYQEFEETRKEIEKDLAEREPRRPAVIDKKSDAARAGITGNSDERLSETKAQARVAPTRRADSLEPRRKRRCARRISKPDKTDRATITLVRRACRPSKDLTAFSGDAGSSITINRVYSSAPIHAPPAIPVD